MKGSGVLMLLALVATAGCSLGQGQGEVKSDKLLARECWHDGYDLKPDFFAAVPYRSTLQIRVQRGTDLQEVSDGLSVMVEDVDRLRASWLHKPLPLTLPPGVLPPDAVPAPAPQPAPSPEQAPPRVHMALYLQRSCHNQNVVLYAVRGTITFDSLFSGDPNEKDAAKKLTVARFGVAPDAGDAGAGGSGGGGFGAGGGDAGSAAATGEKAVMMGDPRDAPPGAPPTAIPDDKLSAVRGSFRFYFERGQPGQPFP